MEALFGGPFGGCGCPGGPIADDIFSAVNDIDDIFLRVDDLNDYGTFDDDDLFWNKLVTDPTNPSIGSWVKRITFDDDFFVNNVVDDDFDQFLIAVSFFGDDLVDDLFARPSWIGLDDFFANGFQLPTYNDDAFLRLNQPLIRTQYTLEFDTPDGTLSEANPSVGECELVRSSQVDDLLITCENPSTTFEYHLRVIPTRLNNQGLIDPYFIDSVACDHCRGVLDSFPMFPDGGSVDDTFTRNRVFEPARGGLGYGDFKFRFAIAYGYDFMNQEPCFEPGCGVPP